MLEADAKTKLCPMKLTRDRVPADRTCDTTACMAWEVWYERPPLAATTVEDAKKIRQKDLDPPQGHCGMIPPKLKGHELAPDDDIVNDIPY